MLALPLALVVALFAGALTTVAGMGGGLLLLVCLAPLVGPHAALALSTPALLVGNLHRLALLRADVRREVAVPLAAGALPGALVGGAVVMRLPPQVVEIAIASACAVALLSCLRARFAAKATHDDYAGEGTKVPRLALALVASVVGALSALGMGAGLVIGPLLLGRGLRGRPYVATGSVVAATLHVGRLGGYAHAGAFDLRVLAAAATLAAAIAMGNALGARFDQRIGAAWRERLHFGALAACAIVALVGLLG